jgi:hypothetical protein
MGAETLSKVIIEGNRLTFKTKIAFGLNEHPPESSDSGVTVTIHR